MRYRYGKIYRIVCNVTGKQYIGSTTQPLSKHLSQHRRQFDLLWSYVFPYTSLIGSMKSFEILENDDYEIVLIENYPCKSKDELERRARYYIDTMDCVNKKQ